LATPSPRHRRYRNPKALANFARKFAESLIDFIFAPRFGRLFANATTPARPRTNCRAGRDIQTVADHLGGVPPSRLLRIVMLLMEIVYLMISL
jgi:hypothetical protein